MPLPISPVGQINSYDNIFSNLPGDDDISMANKRFKEESENKDVIALLETIDKHQDHVVNAAAEYVSSSNDKYYNVPPAITDESLLKLKTGGYCLGGGRTVRFSDKAKNLLKKRYLSTENAFKAQRVKKQIF